MFRVLSLNETNRVEKSINDYITDGMCDICHRLAEQGHEQSCPVGLVEFMLSEYHDLLHQTQYPDFVVMQGGLSFDEQGRMVLTDEKTRAEMVVDESVVGHLVGTLVRIMVGNPDGPLQEEEDS